jgi:hypothetical protein
MNVVSDDAMGCAVVGLDGCGRLLVAHLFKEVLHGDCFMGGNVKGTKFGFGCTGHNSLEYFGNVEHGTIVGWVVNVGQAEKVAADLAAGLLRYEASLWMANTKSLFLYVRIASGLVAT